jgi:hypothetical protein
MGKLGSTIGLLLFLLILPFENNAQDINSLLKERNSLKVHLKNPKRCKNTSMYIATSLIT